MRTLILILTVLCLSGFSSDRYYEAKAKGGCFEYDGNLICTPEVKPDPQVDKIKALEERISALEALNDEGVTITTCITED